MKELRIVFEVEVSSEPEISPAVLQRAWGRNSNYHEMVMDPERVQDIAHEQALLTALRANPAVYAEFVKAAVVGRLELLSGRDFFRLARVQRQEYEVLADLIDQLPEPAAAYFQEAVAGEWLHNATELLTESFTFHYPTITVEDLPSAP